MSQEGTRNPNLDLFAPPPGAAGESWRANLGRETVEFPRGASWWTGRDPSDPSCPGRGADGVVRALPIPDLSGASRGGFRERVRAYFENGWALTEILFAGLVSEEAFYRPPYHGLRHPMVFYYVHPAALYVNKLRVAGLLRDPVDPLFEQLFETGVDEMSWDDLSKNEMEWPALSVCRAYRRRVFETVSRLVDAAPGLADGQPPVTMDSPLWALFLAFEHERIHLETSSVLIRELPLALVRRPSWFPAPHGSAVPSARGELPEWREPVRGGNFPENPLVPVAAGRVRVGKDRSFPTFGWDNEYGSRDAVVEPFAASRRLVTNGDFHEFVASGGYRDDRWWTETGRRWRAFRNVKWPAYWVATGPQGSHRFALRTVFDVVPMPWDWPVCANHHEAKAWCAWKSARDGRRVPLRLPTENEFHRIRAVAGLCGEGRAPSAAECDAVFRAEDLNHSLRHGSESPVSLSARPFGDAAGNVWQWTEDDFHPLAGFRVHPHYDDFSTPCFDGKHSMILGGSFISAGDEASLHARFHFRPHFFQHAGFRFVDPLREGNDGGVVRVEEPRERAPQGDRASRLFASYAPADALLPAGLPSHRDVIAAKAGQWAARLGVPTDRALDIGSGPGGTAYALAATWRDVTAADISETAVEDGRRALATADLRLTPGEGEAAGAVSVRIDPARAARVAFRQTDASSLPADWMGFGLVLASGILTRLPSPKSLLGRMDGARGLVAPGGLLIVADTWRWDPAVTPEELRLPPDAAGIAAHAGRFEVLETFECLAADRPTQSRAVLDTLRCMVLRRTV